MLSHSVWKGDEVTAVPSGPLNSRATCVFHHGHWDHGNPRIATSTGHGHGLASTPQYLIAVVNASAFRQMLTGFCVVFLKTIIFRENNNCKSWL